MRQNTINTLCVTVHGNAFCTHFQHGYPQGDTGYPRLFVDNLFHGPRQCFTSAMTWGFRGRIDHRLVRPMGTLFELPGMIRGDNKTAAGSVGSTVRRPNHSFGFEPRKEGLPVIIPGHPDGAQVVPIHTPARAELWARLQLARACLAHGRVDRVELLAILDGAQIADLLDARRVS